MSHFPGSDAESMDTDSAHSDGEDATPPGFNTPAYDRGSLPPRDLTGARLQRFGNSWQGWNDRCPRTGLPAGREVWQCRCPQSDSHQSKTQRFGDEVGVSDEQAMDMAMRWIRGQHIKHIATCRPSPERRSRAVHGFVSWVADRGVIGCICLWDCPQASFDG